MPPVSTSRIVATGQMALFPGMERASSGRRRRRPPVPPAPSSAQRERVELRLAVLAERARSRMPIYDAEGTVPEIAFACAAEVLGGFDSASEVEIDRVARVIERQLWRTLAVEMWRAGWRP